MGRGRRDLRPLRCTLVSPSLAKGGAETQLVQLARGLHGRGWAVQVVSMLSDDGLAGELRDTDVVHLGMRRGRASLSGIWRCVGAVRRHRPHVLISFTYPGNMLGRVVGRLTRVPVIVSSIRGERFGGRLRERLMRVTGWMDTVTSTNSRAVSKALIDRGIVAASKMKVIPNALIAPRSVPDGPETSRLRAELRLELGEFLWLAVGRIESPKDYPGLIRAFAQVEVAVPSRLLIAGDGPLRAEIQELIERLSLGDRVKLLGFRNDVAALLHAADGLVLSSAHEGLPNAVMEALGAGKPVVATDVGGVRELVEDGSSGIIVPPGDPAKLAEGLERLMSLTAEERSAMGRVGRRHIEEHFALEPVLDDWEALLFERLRPKRGSEMGS